MQCDVFPAVDVFPSKTPRIFVADSGSSLAKPGNMSRSDSSGSSWIASKIFPRETGANTRNHILPPAPPPRTARKRKRSVSNAPSLPKRKPPTPPADTSALTAHMLAGMPCFARLRETKPHVSYLGRCVTFSGFHTCT